MKEEKIRIRMEAYDHRVLDRSAKQIVETATRTGAKLFTLADSVTFPYASMR